MLTLGYQHILIVDFKYDTYRPHNYITYDLYHLIRPRTNRLLPFRYDNFSLNGTIAQIHIQYSRELLPDYQCIVSNSSTRKILTLNRSHPTTVAYVTIGRIA